MSGETNDQTKTVTPGQTMATVGILKSSVC